jgi:hypothetical protein
MNYKEMQEQLANARPASFAPTSAGGLSPHDVSIIKGLAPAIHAYVKEEIERALVPLRTELAVLKALAESRPPAAERERGHENDASRGPTLSDWRQ